MLELTLLIALVILILVFVNTNKKEKYCVDISGGIKGCDCQNTCNLDLTKK